MNVKELEKLVENLKNQVSEMNGTKKAAKFDLKAAVKNPLRVVNMLNQAKDVPSVSAFLALAGVTKFNLDMLVKVANPVQVEGAPETVVCKLGKKVAADYQAGEGEAVTEVYGSMYLYSIPESWSMFSFIDEAAKVAKIRANYELKIAKNDLKAAKKAAKKTENKTTKKAAKKAANDLSDDEIIAIMLQRGLSANVG